MKEINAINVVYNEDVVPQFIFISGFIKMCGIFVFEQKLYEDKEIIHNNIATYLIIYKNDIGVKKLYDWDLEKQFSANFFGIPVADKCEKYNFWQCQPSFDNKKDSLQELANKIMGKDETVKKLVNVYFEYSLYFNDFMTDIKYLSPKTKKPAVFQRALNELACGNDRYNKYLYYFRVYIKRCCCVLGNSNNHENDVSPEDLLRDCQEISQKSPDCFAAFLLAADICWENINYRIWMKDYLNSSISGVDYNYLGYYKMGTYYEKMIGDKRKALMYYKMASEINFFFFRSDYKEAIFLEFDKFEFEKAITLYKKIIARLKRYAEKSVLLPLEYEYLCKAYSSIARIINKCDNQYESYTSYYRDIISLEDRAEDIIYNTMMKAYDNKSFRNDIDVNIFTKRFDTYRIKNVLNYQ